MANLIDYLAWRGDVSFEVSPWNEVDGLLCAVLSYLNFHGLQDHRGWTLEEAKRIDLLIEDKGTMFPPRKKVFEAMAESERFGGCRMHHFIALTDEDVSMQFSAVCADLPDGTMAVIFRGTDNTLVGWREDFNMSYQTRVPGQQAAAYYLSKAVKVTDRPIRLMGHSKGGNLAVYAAAAVPEKTQNRITDIWTYDGPGMNQEIARSDGFDRIREKIHSYIPQTSIIGLLMEYYKPYTVVRSVAKGLEQHDPMTWQVYGTRFERMGGIDRTASVTSETLHEMLTNSTPEQRASFVDTLFQLAENTNASTMSDILNEKFRSMLKIAGGRKELNPETRKIFNRLLGQAVSLGVGNVVDRVRGRNEQDGPDEWKTLDPAGTEKQEKTGEPAAEAIPAAKEKPRKKKKAEKAESDLDKSEDV